MSKIKSQMTQQKENEWDEELCVQRYDRNMNWLRII